MKNVFVKSRPSSPLVALLLLMSVGISLLTLSAAAGLNVNKTSTAIATNSTTSNTTTTATPKSLLKLAVYFESLCSDSRAFVLNQLVPAHAKLGAYLDLDLVPYGNVRVSTNESSGQTTYHCQHGEEECWGNRVEACAIAQSTTQKQGLAFVSCLFNGSNWRAPRVKAAPCATTVSLDWERIATCNSGGQGEQLIATNRVRTESLLPKKTFIPWITINGEHRADTQSNALGRLSEYLCTDYLSTVPECKKK